MYKPPVFTGGYDFTKRYLGVALSFNADYDIAGDILLKLSMSLLVAGRSYWNW
ncbi:conserved hypothetical protein [Streptococcus equi subsp. zooepidemicus ATCC 35246]|nr:conserved hypothetical protein [Streptococcus equi subsp. zooepidemicus ATCC 35246]